jgi:iron complex outermembrane receptor protein
MRPQWMATIGADYNAPLTGKINLKAHLEYNYRSDIQTVTGAMLGDITALREACRWHLHAQRQLFLCARLWAGEWRITLAKADDGIEVGVYARNLLNQYFSTGWQIYGRSGCCITPRPMPIAPLASLRR